MHLQGIGLFVVALAALYGMVSWLRSQRRNESGKCARCGTELTPDTQNQVPFDIELPAGGAVVTMCPRCAELTVHNHRVGYYFILSCGLVGLAVALVSSVHPVADAVRTQEPLGKGLNWQFYALITSLGLLAYAKSIKQSIRSKC